MPCGVATMGMAVPDGAASLWSPPSAIPQLPLSRSYFPTTSPTSAIKHHYHYSPVHRRPLADAPLAQRCRGTLPSPVTCTAARAYPRPANPVVQLVVPPHGDAPLLHHRRDARRHATAA